MTKTRGHKRWALKITFETVSGAAKHKSSLTVLPILLTLPIPGSNQFPSAALIESLPSLATLQIYAWWNLVSNFTECVLGVSLVLGK
jgi:hypothetical protein